MARAALLVLVTVGVAISMSSNSARGPLRTVGSNSVPDDRALPSPQLRSVSERPLTPPVRVEPNVGQSAENARQRLADVRQHHTRLPITFEPNVGQTDKSVRYIGRAPGYTLFLREDDALIRVAAGSNEPHDVVRMRFVGGTPSGPLAEQPQQVRIHYYSGADPSEWRPNVPTFARTRYTEMYPGIDAAFYGNGHELEYDLVVAPGADPSIIRVAFEGLTGIEMDESGDLVLHTASTELRQRKPVVYQQIDSRHVAIDGEYVLGSEGAHEVAFRIGPYDENRPLVIDPVIDDFIDDSLGTFSGVLGGSGDERLNAVDAHGSRIVAGGTTSSPQFAGGPGSTTGSADLIVLDFTYTDGVPTLQSRTVLSGSGVEVMGDLKIDAEGNVLGLGSTLSSDMPIAGSPFQSTRAGSMDMYLFKLNPSGTLVASSYYGGGNFDSGNALDLDADGNPVIVSTTFSSGLATIGAFQTTMNAGAALVAYISEDLSSKRYATYLDGSQMDGANDVGVRASDGRVAVAGFTSSSNFPTVGTSPPHAGGSDAFMGMLRIEGQALTVEKLVVSGGAGDDAANAVAFSQQASAAGGSTVNDSNRPEACATATSSSGREADLGLFFLCVIYGDDFLDKRVGTLESVFGRVEASSIEVTEDEIVVAGTTAATNMPGLQPGSPNLSSVGVLEISNLNSAPTATILNALPQALNTLSIAVGHRDDAPGDAAALNALLEERSGADSYERRIQRLTPSGATYELGSSVDVPRSTSSIVTLPATSGLAETVLTANDKGVELFEIAADGTYRPRGPIAGTNPGAWQLTLGERNTVFGIGTSPLASWWMRFDQQPDGTFTAGATPIDFKPIHIAAASNKDGTETVAVGGHDRIDLFVRQHDGSQVQQHMSVEKPPGGLALGDADGDGMSDLFFTTGDTVELSTFPFESRMPIASGTGPIQTFVKPGNTRASFITTTGRGSVLVYHPQPSGPFYNLQFAKCGGFGPTVLQVIGGTVGGTAIVGNCHTTDGFLLKINVDTGDVETRLFGGSGDDSILDMAVTREPSDELTGSSGNDNLVLVGSAQSGFPVTDGSTHGGGNFDGVILNITDDSPATVSFIAPQAMDEDAQKTIAFTIGDEDPDTVVVTATSSNQTLLPNARLSLSGSGAGRTLVIAPSADLSGTATVSVTVTDGNGASTTRSFVVTVNAVNDAPTMSVVPDQATDEDRELFFDVTVNDAETGDLAVTAVVDDTTLVPLENVQVLGVGNIRTVRIKPAPEKSGKTRVTLVVRDATGATSERIFNLTVNPVNDPPTISRVSDQAVGDSQEVTVTFTVNDKETDPEDLVVTVRSGMLSASDYVLTGSHRTGQLTLRITLPSYAFSESVVLTVRDGGGATASTSFLVTGTGAAPPTQPTPPAPPPLLFPPVNPFLEAEVGPAEDDRPRPVILRWYTLTGQITSPDFAANGDAAPTGFTIEIGSRPGASDVAIYTTGVTSTFTIRGLEPGTYYIRVRAFNDAGSSDASNEVIVTIPDPTGAPRNLRAAVRDRVVDVAWDPPASMRGVVGFLVEVGSASGLADMAAEMTTALAFTIPDVPDGRYFVRVKTVTGRRQRLASNEVAVIVGLPPGSCGLPPGAPRALAGQVIGTFVDLSWLAPDSGDPPDMYVIHIGTATGRSDEGMIAVEAGTTRVSGPVPNGTHVFRIVPANECGAGAASNEIALTVGGPPPVPPGAPQSLTADVLGSRVALNWAPPFAGDMPTRYVIEVLSTSGELLASFDTGNAATSFVYDNAPAGVYVVRIRGANGAGVGPASATVVVTVSPPDRSH